MKEATNEAILRIVRARPPQIRILLRHRVGTMPLLLTFPPCISMCRLTQRLGRDQRVHPTQASFFETTARRVSILRKAGVTAAVSLTLTTRCPRYFRQWHCGAESAKTLPRICLPRPERTVEDSLGRRMQVGPRHLEGTDNNKCGAQRRKARPS